MREQLSNQFIKGSGIEIGGLHFPLPVPEGTKVAYIDRMPLEQLKAENPTLDVQSLNIIVDSAESLSSVPDNSQDFVIANHVLEHCENPLLALENWRRVLKPGGVVYAAIPNKDHTFDIKREVTSQDHILKDYWDGPDESALDHYIDWYKNSTLEGLKGDALAKRVAEAHEARANIHFHVWDLKAIESLAQLAQFMFFKYHYVHVNGSEVIVILIA